MSIFNPISILLSEESPVLFGSDSHFFHNRIVEFTKRTTTIENHNQWLIEQYNKRATPETTVFHLGDLFFKSTNEEAVEILRQLNGTWMFILGNHCNPSKIETVINTCNKLYGTKHELLGWYTTLTLKQFVGQNLPLKRKSIVLCHFPIQDWANISRGAIHLHGHCHGMTSSHDNPYYSLMPNRLDVGVDNHPEHLLFTWEEIKERLKCQREQLETQ